MGQTDNSLNVPESFTVDVGDADIFLGNYFERPWFFDSMKWKMMEDCKPEFVHIKTWKGEMYQFRLYQFHNQKAMIITSTLMDTFICIKAAGWGLKKTMNYARRAKRTKHEVEGSFSGYWTWGKYFEEQYSRLKKHMKDQNIFFSDEALESIYEELVRRNNEKNNSRTSA